MAVCYRNLQVSLCNISYNADRIQSKSYEYIKEKWCQTRSFIHCITQSGSYLFRFALASRTMRSFVELWSARMTAWCGKSIAFPGLPGPSTSSIIPFLTDLSLHYHILLSYHHFGLISFSIYSNDFGSFRNYQKLMKHFL